MTDPKEKTQIPLEEDGDPYDPFEEEKPKKNRDLDKGFDTVNPDEHQDH